MRLLRTALPNLESDNKPATSTQSLTEAPQEKLYAGNIHIHIHYSSRISLYARRRNGRVNLAEVYGFNEALKQDIPR